MKMRRVAGRLVWCTVLACAEVSAAASCARVPNETVQLSTALGSDLADTHRAHRALVDDHFALIRQLMVTFVQTKYCPFLIRYLLTEEGYDKEFASAVEKSKTGSPALIDLAEIFTDELSRQVTAYQAGLTGTVDSIEREVLARVDARYTLMSTASAELTGYLASLAKLQAAREATLKSIGLGGIEQDVGTTVAALSDRVAQLNAKAEKIEGEVEQGKQKAAEGLEQFRALRESVAPAKKVAP